MTEFTVSRRSDLDTENAGDEWSDEPMDVTTEMATSATSIAAETVGTAIFDIMETHKNRKWRRRSEAPADSSDWRSRNERIIRQQVQELTQVH